MENLPHEVLSDIFIQLSAKQLAQMRRVCKDWNALLSESSFVKSHLHRSIHHNDEILMFFGFGFDCISITARPSHSPKIEFTNFFKFHANPQSERSFGNIIGSVNGLICFYYRVGDDYAVCIRNHSLSAVLTLPPCSLGSSHNPGKIYFRFGYDPKTDDYKLVKLIALFNPRRMEPQVEVYSLRKGSWELIFQSFPSHITGIKDEDEVCVDGHEGHVHWLCYTGLNWMTPSILAFDLSVKTFSEIPLPDSLLDYGGHECFIVLGVLAGKLCVMSCIFESGKCELWVMDEYGVAESWVKHHAFSQFNGDDRIIPFGFTSRSEFLFGFMDDVDRYDLYDLVTTKTKTFKIHKLSNGSKVVEYVDSPVWIAPANKLNN